ncbi:hypothetical protein [Pseudomonas sp. PA27(2017)]|uniref:hypothetical protein n=1 Tax=Pseudomonas sp. PA27(2017) TaxID=1932112 RepID=UPI0035321770
MKFHKLKATEVAGSYLVNLPVIETDILRMARQLDPSGQTRPSLIRLGSCIRGLLTLFTAIIVIVISIAVAAAILVATIPLLPIVALSIAALCALLQ